MKSLIGHEPLREYLKNISVGTLPGHAFLFVGPSGVGKRTLAQWFCDQLSAAELFLLPQDQEASSISVTDVREILSRIGRSTFNGGRRVIFIPRAERLTTEAGNALLKVIEEPAPDTIFLLCVSSTDRLLQTIVSRCQVIRMPLVSEKVIAEALADRGYDDTENIARFSAGRPGIALRAAEDKKYKERVMQQCASLKKFISEPLWQRAVNAATYEGEDVISTLETALHLFVTSDYATIKDNTSFLFGCADQLRELHKAPQLASSRTALDRLLILSS